MATSQVSLPAGFKLETDLSSQGGLPAGFQLEPSTKSRSWGDVAGSAAANFLPSVGKMASDIGSAVMNPIDTAKGVLDLGAGALQNAVPESVKNAVNKLDWNPQAAQRAETVADAVGQQYKQKYGTMEGFKEALATDPASVLADASTVLTGGSTVVPKLAKAAAAVDPMVLALRGAQATGSGLASGAKKIAGMTTGAGEEALSQAFQAGKKGGAIGQSFADNIRGNAPMTDVLDSARSNLDEMGRKKSAEYRSGMVDISNDKSTLGFQGIDSALGRASEYGKYKGQVTNPKAADAVAEAQGIVNNWKNLDPAEFHTPEGMDKLKQSIGGVLESIPYEQKAARASVEGIYNAVKDEIKTQAPTYSKVMGDYAQATDQIKEIERALSLGERASADTAMRKLQSLMRNNANTNYGQRLSLAKQLEEGGGKSIMPALAGQALNEWTPRGLQRATAAPTAMLGYSTGGLPLAGAAAAVSSPRLMGEASYLAGQTAGLPNRVLATNPKAQQLVEMLRNGGKAAGDVIDPRIAANLTYQANQLRGQ